MKWIGLAVLLFLLTNVAAVRADQSIANVQQALKDQGFYYGDVTGTKTDNTTAAIRRYQIRNGLQVTGEIDAETLRSLGITGGRSAPTAPRKSEPVSKEENDSSEQNSNVQSAEISPPAQPNYRPAQPNYPNQPRYPGQPYYPPNAAPGEVVGPHHPVSDVFLGTPYEMAPPDLQRHVVVGAQTLLARHGLYQSGIDGEFGPGTEAAVRAFQAQAHLAIDGRLNLSTLAALGLLPGQHGPAFPPRVRPYPGHPIYRGEWVPDR